MHSEAGNLDVNLCNLYFSLGTLLYAVFQAMFVGEQLIFWPNQELGLLVLSGLFGWMLQVFFVMALRFETPSNVQLFSSVNVLVSLLGDYFVFGQPISGMTVFGSVILIGSLAILTKKKHEAREFIG